MWADRTPQQAHEILALPDVSVTNQSDKEMQLSKLIQLDEEVRDVVRQLARPPSPPLARSLSRGGHGGGSSKAEGSGLGLLGSSFSRTPLEV